MKYLLPHCAAVLALVAAMLPAAAQRAAGSGTANASVIDPATIGVPPPASTLAQFGNLFDVAGALADPAAARVVLPRGAGAFSAGAGGGPQAAPAVTVQRNADGSVSVDVTGGGPAYAVTQSPSGAVSIEYN